MKAALVLCALLPLCGARTKCYRVTGKVECERDPAKVDSTEVRLLDRDSVAPFKLLDQDDTFAKGFAASDGSFDVSGCAEDVDWLWIFKRPNDPEPRMQLFHFCTQDSGSEWNSEEFPNVKHKEFGTIKLDDL